MLIEGAVEVAMRRMHRERRNLQKELERIFKCPSIYDKETFEKDFKVLLDYKETFLRSISGARAAINDHTTEKTKMHDLEEINLANYEIESLWQRMEQMGSDITEKAQVVLSLENVQKPNLAKSGAVSGSTSNQEKSLVVSDWPGKRQ